MDGVVAHMSCSVLLICDTNVRNGGLAAESESVKTKARRCSTSFYRFAANISKQFSSALGEETIFPFNTVPKSTPLNMILAFYTAAIRLQSYRAHIQLMSFQVRFIPRSIILRPALSPCSSKPGRADFLLEGFCMVSADKKRHRRDGLFGTSVTGMVTTKTEATTHPTYNG